MSDDWKVGDLALCVDNSPDCTGTAPTMDIGQVSRVTIISSTGCLATEATGRWTWIASRFRKIRPDEHEDCEPEFVTLLNHIKRKVEACPPAINAAEKLAVGMVRR